MTTNDTVTLIGNLSVSRAALELAWSLEARGHVMSAKDGNLHVTNGTALTVDDRAAIRAQRLQLLGILGYCQEGHEPRWRG